MKVLYYLHLFAVANALSLIVNEKEHSAGDLASKVPFRSSLSRLQPHIQQDSIKVPMVQGKTIGEHIKESIMTSRAPREPPIPQLKSQQRQQESKSYSSLQRLKKNLSFNNHFVDEMAQEEIAETLSSANSASPTASPDEEPTNVFSPSVILNSKVSWVKDFILFKTSTRDTNPSAISGRKGPLDPQDQLSSNIKTYEDLLSDDSNLKQWTEYVVGQKSAADKKFSDYNYKKYGRLDDVGQEEGTRIDITEFIEYLVKVHGFDESSLGFLDQQALDHGIEEIERELNKIKEKENQGNTIIDIGGDIPPNTGSTTPIANSGSTVRYATVTFLAFQLLHLILV